jgi:GNAT superfamily N-acetyltransferase
MDSSSLAQRVTANMFDLFAHLGRAPAVAFSRCGALSGWRTPVPHAWFNGILLLAAARPGDDERFDALASVLGDAPFTVWPARGIDRSGWDRLLQQRGHQFEPGAPGMALDLAALPATLDAPSGMTVSPVRDSDALLLWCRTFLQGYGLPEAWLDGFHTMMAQAGSALPLDHWLGFLDGEPVATSSVFDSAGVAGVNFVATRPGWRRRGIGALMTRRPLYEARARGMRFAVLSASDAGYTVYRRLGFQHVSNVGNYHR